MLRLIFWRLVQMPVILAIIFLVTFVLAWVLPGNPLERSDKRPPPEVAAAMKSQYNLDNPWRFMAKYLHDALLHGDLGPSLSNRQVTVSDILRQSLPVSVTVGVAGLIVALVLGLAAGIIGALRPGTALDLSSSVMALLGVSLPSFVTGSILLVVFAGVLKWVPVGGWSDDWGLRWQQIILPAVTLGLAPAAYIARLTRLGLAEVMNSDFIRTAKAKGVGPGRILFRHALKVAFLPVLSFLGPAAAVTMTGSFVVERIFNIPGLGRFFVDSVLNKDQFVILGVVLVYATMLVLFNLLVDVAYAWVDPRIEL
jgi:oligopeptide transport system permease protein